VAQLHERFHATLSAVVTELAKDAGVASRDAHLAAAAFVTFLEGALLHDQDHDFDQVVSFLVRRLVG
jgi:hypothetical protein